MFGKGLLTGLKITFKRMRGPHVTEYYPEERPQLPSRTRSSLVLDNEKCIACGMCAITCPNQAITITTEKNENNKKILTSYLLDTGRCLYCGMCSEACPTGALVNSPEFENAVYYREDLVWDMLQRSQGSDLIDRKEA